MNSFTFSRIFATAFLLVAFATESAHAGLFSPFRRGFTTFMGGHAIRAPEADATRIDGLDFLDAGVDVAYREHERPVGPKKIQTFVRLRTRFIKKEWTLIVNGDPQTAIDAAAGLYEFELNLDSPRVEFSIVAIDPLGQLTEEKWIFEGYDWDVYQAEKKVTDLSPMRELRLSGGVAAHAIAEYYSSITTWTLAQISAPELRAEGYWWKAKLPESRAWVWGAHAAAAFALPLQGVFLAPLWDVGGVLMRRNIARAVIAERVITFHPGLSIRFQGLSQGGLNQVRSGSSVVLNSFTPRMSLLGWVDLFATVVVPIRSAVWEFTPRFSRTLYAYSFLTDGTNGFANGGWGAALRAVGTLPQWKKEWFGAADLNFFTTMGDSTQGVTDYALLLSVGRRF